MWDAAESDSGRFSAFYPELPVNHSCGITGSPIVLDESGPMIPSPVILQDSSQLPDPLNAAIPEGWIRR